MKFRPLLPLVLTLILFPVLANAQWATTGTLVSAMPNDQRYITSCSDGAGGAFIAWEDLRVDFNSDLYVQRINAAGVPQWTAQGLGVCTLTGAQWQPRLVSDGAGGAIVAWTDSRNGTLDVYAQRLNASGASLWTANGVVVCNAAADQQWQAMVADGVGGAIIAWYDARTPTNMNDIYAQRINSSGVPQWFANGVAVCNIAQDQTYPQIVSDQAQGAIICWSDSRGAAPLPPDLYAQRVLSNGSMAWTANGVVVCNATNYQGNQKIISDGANGAIVAWADYRSGSNYDIYAQRLGGAAGASLWTANGLAVCTVGNDQFGPSLVSDGNQGAFIAWMDERAAAFNNDVYIQHVGSPGIALWTPGGVALASDFTNIEQEVQLTSDASNGVIAVWVDTRDGPAGELYAQRLTNNGSVVWGAGMRLTTNPFVETTPIPIADGSGNVILSFSTGQIYTDANVYATRIDGRFGYWGKPEPTLFAVKDVPNDQGGKVRVEWYASSRDQLNQQTILKYTIWRAIDQALYANSVAAGVPEVKATDPASSFSNHAVRHEKLQALDYFWELIGTQSAAYRYAYSFTAETSFDSTATNSATHRFQILAHANSDLINWPSNILTGRSVDNIAPPPPLFLSAQRVGNNVVLKWKGVHVPDLDKYKVYRGTSTGVTPIAADFLADDPDTVMTDSSAPTSAVYYIVTATDVHQNQSLKSNEASVAATTNAGNLPPINALTVMQNHPNPFTGETQLQVGLPAKGDVRVEIYDVAGRRVRTTLMPARAKGWNTLRLTALDDRGAALPSGVYFYKVHAGAEAVTKKMVVTR